MIKTVDELRAKIVPILQEALGDQLICAFAHGVCADPQFVPGVAPWEVSLFVKELDSDTIPDLSAVLKPFSKAGAELHYLFTPDMVKRAEDTYPLEFLNYSRRHLLLCGTLPIANFEPLRPWLRLQCERELRGLLIHLHREVALRGNSDKDLRTLLRIAPARFVPIFHGAIWLVKGEYPQSISECLRLIAEHWNLESLLTRLVSLPKDSKELRTLAGDYILGMQKILQTIDQLEETP